MARYGGDFVELEPGLSAGAAPMPDPDDDPWTIMDWIDQVNSDPDVEDDDDESTEWDEMADWDLDDEEDDEEEDL